MKKIRIPTSVMVENRVYKPGEYAEADITAEDLAILLAGGHAEVEEINPSGGSFHEVGSQVVTNEDATHPMQVLDLLNLKADEIKDLLSDESLTEEDFAALSQAEAEGKNRKSVIKAIEDELATRKAAAEAAGKENDKELFE